MHSSNQILKLEFFLTNANSYVICFEQAVLQCWYNNDWLHVPGGLTDCLTVLLTDWLQIILRINWLMDWLTYLVTEWLWLTKWLTCCWRTDRLTDLLIDWLNDWLTVDWQTGKLIDWLADFLYWLTGWLFCWLTDWLIGWLTCWVTDWFINLLTS